MGLFGIDADHRGGRRRWPAFAWPLLGALTGTLLAPLIVHLLRDWLPAEPGWLLPALVVLCVLGMSITFVLLARRGRRG